MNSSRAFCAAHPMFSRKNEFRFLLLPLRQLKVAILKFSLMYLINNVHVAASGIQLPIPLKPAASSNLFIYRLEEVAGVRNLPLHLIYLLIN